MTSTEGNESHEPSRGLLAGGHPLPSLRPHKNRNCITRRYNRIVVNLIARIPLPRQLERLTLVIDKGGTGNTPERLRQQRHSLAQLFQNRIKSRATHIAIRVRDSHSDRCLQMVDVLTNFVSQGFRISEKIERLEGNISRRKPNIFSSAE